MWTRSELKTRAKAVLKGCYWKAFLVSIILAIAAGSSGGGGGRSNGSMNRFASDGTMEGLFSSLPFIIAGGFTVFIIALAFKILLGYPLEVGGQRFFVQAAQREVNLSYLGLAFEKDRYLPIIKAMFWRGLYNFLWFLLLIIPGIVRAYAYRMVPYILGDNPHIGTERAIDLSIQMTKGHKFDIFVLDLSFIGWYLLGVIALVVGVLFVLPYVNATNAELYLTLREKALQDGITNYEELNLIPPEAIA